GSRLDTPRVSGSYVFLSRDLDCSVYFAQLETRFAAHQIARREYSAANVVRSNNSTHICTTDPRGIDAPYQLGAGDPGFSARIRSHHSAIHFRKNRYSFCTSGRSDTCRGDGAMDVQPHRAFLLRIAAAVPPGPGDDNPACDSDFTRRTDRLDGESRYSHNSSCRDGGT